MMRLSRIFTKFSTLIRRRKKIKSVELEKKLVEKEKQYQDIYETANSIIIKWDPEFSILAINPYCEDFFSVKSRDIEGKDLVRDLFNVHSEKINSMKSLLWNIFQLPNQFIIQEYDVYLKNDDRRTISWSNRIFRNESGNPYEVLSIGNDITNRKVAEEKLKRAVEEAKSANKSKSIFFSKITHELRTPLHAVMGLSQILAKDPYLPQHLKGYVDSLHQNGVHLLSMINDLLDLSKIEAGKMTENKERFSLHKLWNTLFSLFAYRFLEKGITFQLKNIEKINNKHYLGDIQKIRQILINLIGNSLKFTNTGYVILEIVVKESNRRPFDLVEFILEDTGIGIPEDQLEIIFEAFHQTEIGSSYQEGTGLGLSISHQLVELLGGTISVTSQIGKGSRFSFEIPLTISESLEDTNLSSPQIQYTSSEELKLKKTEEVSEVELVKKYLESLDDVFKNEIINSIRLQDFQKLLNSLEKIKSTSPTKSILEERAKDKKFKFFIDLIQSLN
jgi:PAS domain S-box-containing protein